jgi:hypothetical protein
MPTSGPEGEESATYGHLKVAVLQLAAVRSQRDVETYLRAFADLKNPCDRCVVVVDGKEVPDAVINSVRRLLDVVGDEAQLAHQRTVVEALGNASAVASLAAGADRAVDGEGLTRDGEVAVHRALASVVQGTATTVKRVFLVIHCPASWLHVRAAYPSLPLHGWQFVYVDAHSPGLGVVSARSWLSAACGVQQFLDDSISQASLRSCNTRVLDAVVQGVAGCLTVAPSASDGDMMVDSTQCNMQAFYCGAESGVSALVRLRALRELEAAMGGETLASLLAPTFLRLWSMSEIQRSVEEATLRCVSKVGWT